MAEGRKSALERLLPFEDLARQILPTQRSPQSVLEDGRLGGSEDLTVKNRSDDVRACRSAAQQPCTDLAQNPVKQIGIVAWAASGLKSVRAPSRCANTAHWVGYPIDHCRSLTHTSGTS